MLVLSVGATIIRPSVQRTLLPRLSVLYVAEYIQRAIKDAPYTNTCNKLEETHTIQGAQLLYQLLPPPVNITDDS
jgi:hypothetical protein